MDRKNKVTWERFVIAALLAINLLMWWNWPSDATTHAGCILAMDKAYEICFEFKEERDGAYEKIMEQSSVILELQDKLNRRGKK